MKEKDNMERIDVSKLEFLRIEPRGRAVNEKFWVADDNVKKLVKVSKNTDQDVMECLTSAILNQINIPCVDVVRSTPESDFFSKIVSFLYCVQDLFLVRQG